MTEQDKDQRVLRQLLALLLDPESVKHLSEEQQSKAEVSRSPSPPWITDFFTMLVGKNSPPLQAKRNKKKC